MKITLLNDIHLEFGPFQLPVTEGEKDHILVLAGDICVQKHHKDYVEFMDEMYDRFREVIYVAGNHEFYKGSFIRTRSKLNDQLKFLVREKETVIIDDVAFICATLWTDMNKMNHILMYQARITMNDYNRIRNGPVSAPYAFTLKTTDTVQDHMNAKYFIFEEIKKQKAIGNKVVVVTHHAPCSVSLSETYKGDKLNGAYYSDLSEEILNTEPNLWCHGHLHNNSDYILGNTRIACNPRGYVGHGTNPDFDPTLVLEL